MERQKFNKLILHPDIRKVVEEINKANIQLSRPISESLSFEQLGISKDSKVSCIEKEDKFKLDAKKGELFLLENKYSLCAYDESKDKYQSLQGIAYATSHSVVLISEKDYIPSNFINFKFYTKSVELAKDKNYIQLVKTDVESEVNKDYHLDRNDFLLNQIPLPKNTILFIDGPLIGGQATTYTNELNNSLLNKEILPIFIVKNSGSDLVIDNIKEINGKYHSDLHWANQLLSVGERTPMFTYTDQDSPEKIKIFFYLKTFKNHSPQRIEFHPNTYQKYKSIFPDVINLIYYLMIAQGNIENAQIRPIAVAEMFARATLRIVKFQKEMHSLNLTPTMNQSRGLEMS